MDCFVHPLAVLGISDHYARALLRSADSTQEIVVGGLMGSQIGTHLDIQTGFEIIFKDGRVDVETLKARAEQIKEVFPDYSIVGWYCVCDQHGQREIMLHNQLRTATGKSLLFLAFKPGNTDDERTFTLYELVDDNFSILHFKTEASEAERIALNEIVKPSSEKELRVTNQYETNLGSLTQLLEKLSESIIAILTYIHSETSSSNIQSSSQQGSQRYKSNRQIIRMIDTAIALLGRRLPDLIDVTKATTADQRVKQSQVELQRRQQSSILSSTFLHEFSDASTSASLAALIMTLNQMEQVRKKFEKFDGDLSKMKDNFSDDDHKQHRPGGMMDFARGSQRRGGYPK
ncbi:MAG: hypothetical protein EZS28_001178 [Streblomastix strix]|uniref:JAB1/MPN/MOV34 metalloenzyme domain-containing protein n=1 Tax=Streblomastix strix TaxID=222440 RepID=A0A5J4X901_9EUKA|nr:MAG: hypothetical protein EZS28_001178 [Streblomastix strix]